VERSESSIAGYVAGRAERPRKSVVMSSPRRVTSSEEKIVTRIHRYLRK
jgi:hypothetical protein